MEGKYWYKHFYVFFSVSYKVSLMQQNPEYLGIFAVEPVQTAT